MGNIANRDLLIARWTELVADPTLHDVAHKIELNAQGAIEMSPANNWHAVAQGHLSWALKDALPHGFVLTECSVLTGIGVRVPDVAWASPEFFAEQGTSTPFARAPEICVAIASPSNTRQEIEAKVQAFLAAGAHEVWVLATDGALACFGPEGLRPASAFGVTVSLPLPRVP